MDTVLNQLFSHGDTGTEQDAKVLNLMGYKQELYRGFTGFMAFAFCFTAVSIIPSISLGFNNSIGVGGPAVLTWWVVVDFALT